jgi:type I restriction enzyme R subunit
MSSLGFERATQDRVLHLFQEKLHYRYLGNWKDQSDNSNIEEKILVPYLQRRGYSVAENQRRALSAQDRRRCQPGRPL